MRISAFEAAYGEYYKRHSGPEHTMLDPAPRAAVWKNRGCIAFGSSTKECGIITDTSHTDARILEVRALASVAPPSKP